MSTKQNLARTQVADPVVESRRQPRGAPKGEWSKEAFVQAVRDEAAREIEESDWPDRWKEMFLAPDSAKFFQIEASDRAAQKRAKQAAHAKRALESLIKVWDAELAEESTSMPGLGKRLAPLRQVLRRALEGALFATSILHNEDVARPPPRRKVIAEVMRSEATRERYALNARQLALMSIRCGWETELSHAWHKLSVAEAIEAEANRMRAHLDPDNLFRFFARGFRQASKEITAERSSTSTRKPTGPIPRG